MNAARDENRVTTVLGWNGTNPVPLRVNPVTGRLLVIAGGYNEAQELSENAVRDNNHVPSGLGVSSEDETVPFPLHCSEDGLLLSPQT